MATDWGLLRWCLYADLMPVFGLPLFALQFLRGGPLELPLRLRLQRIAGFAAALGLLLSVGGMLLMCLQMSGAESFAQMDMASVHMLAVGTDFGLMWQVRMASLVLVVLLMAGRRTAGVVSTAVACIAGAVALASLAWAGHGAMDEGVRRYGHLAADIAHLLAAGAWVGALLAFLVAGFRCAREAAGAALFGRCLAGFARTGTGIVSVLVFSGVVNYLMIAGPTWTGLLSSGYGRLLVLKILLFVLMLALASLNRLRLVPALERAAPGAATSAAVRMVRASVLVESALALLVLALVAWLGTQAPMSAN